MLDFQKKITRPAKRRVHTHTHTCTEHKAAPEPDSNTTEIFGTRLITETSCD
jgi:hypothetical protein